MYIWYYYIFEYVCTQIYVYTTIKVYKYISI